MVAQDFPRKRDGGSNKSEKKTRRATGGVGRVGPGSGDATQQAATRCELIISSVHTQMLYRHVSSYVAHLAREHAVPNVRLMVLAMLARERNCDESRIDCRSGVPLHGIAPDQIIRLDLGRDAPWIPQQPKPIEVEVKQVDAVVGLSDGADVMYTIAIRAADERTLTRFTDDATKHYRSLFASALDVTMVHVGSKYGHWMKSDPLPRRPLDTVVLDADAMTRLVRDIDAFRAAESDYVRHGMPYKRVFCLYGPPGTGKTSTIFALASHFRADVAMMNLSRSIEDIDGTLVQLVQNVPRNAFLVFEDVDAAFPPRKPRSSPSEPTGGPAPMLSTLLNILDGNLRKHGMIVFLTTNHIDQMDPALVRTGRVDVALELNYATPEQAAALYRVYHPHDAKGERKLRRLIAASSDAANAAASTASTADLNALLFEHRHDAAALWAVLDSGTWRRQLSS